MGPLNTPPPTRPFLLTIVLSKHILMCEIELYLGQGDEEKNRKINNRQREDVCDGYGFFDLPHT